MIIDTHMHLGPIIGHYDYPYPPEKLLELMDDLEIQYAISAHNAPLSSNGFELGEQQTKEYFDMSGGRFRAYHYFDPRVADRSLTFMKRNCDNGIYVGIKIHPSFNYTDASDERYRACWDFARTHKLPIMSHTWDLSPTNPKQKYSHPTAFIKYLEEYPDVPFIFGHSGGRFNAIVIAAELGQRFPQTYFDIAGDIHIADLVEFLTDRVGDHRILYGSDYAMMDPRTMIGAVLGANISIQSKERILHDNSAELFKLY